MPLLEERIERKTTPIFRLYNLDYLRGITALGIMMFHYMSWTFGEFSASTFMGRVGIYGVSIFYILSGLTLFYVYYQKMTPSLEEVADFLKKRIFRLFPLLWIVTLLSIWQFKKTPDALTIFLNLTGLFGFVDWDNYLASGAWSIGNELVFYALFPVFVLLGKKHKPLMALLSVLLLGVYGYFAFVIVPVNSPLNGQWKNYINPLNQVFLFLGGFLIGYFLKAKKTKQPLVWLLLLIGFSIFLLYPAAGNRMNLVVGSARFVFTACCFLICIGFYKLQITLPTILHKPLLFLGETSYSIYLLHRISWVFSGFVFTFFNKHVVYLPKTVRLSFSVALTLFVSYFVYHYIEKYFMKLGRSKVVLQPQLS